MSTAGRRIHSVCIKYNQRSLSSSRNSKNFLILPSKACPPPPSPHTNSELKHQTFSTGRRRPEVKFTSDPRFPPTWSAVATRRLLCFAYFDVACKTWVSPSWFSFLYIILPSMFCTYRCLKYYSIVLALVRVIVKYLQSFFELLSL